MAGKNTEIALKKAGLGKACLAKGFGLEKSFGLGKNFCLGEG